jgi:hypothetical protein
MVTREPASFWRRGGWRAVLRALLFLVLTVVLLAITALGIGFTLRGLTAAAVNEAASLVVIIALSWAFGRLERRRLADYGLPWRSALGLRFWQGAGVGLASLTALMLALTVAGASRLDPFAVPSGKSLLLAVAFALLFLVVALFEEFTTRGYLQFALGAGIGFWPAAVVTSLLFALPHFGNGGESLLGVGNAAAIGLVFCLLLRRTGSLWAGIGFHAAWDWGENWLYGVADSGMVLPAHLLHAAPAGPAWLSGGEVGPEGSVLCTAVVMLTALACAWLFRRKPADAALSPAPPESARRPFA